MPSDKVVGINAAPHALEAERSVLGACMLHPDSFSRASDHITAEAFFRQNHANIYRTMESLADRGRDFSPASIRNEAKQLGFSVTELLTDLTDIMDSVSTYAGVETHCQIVMEKYILRRLIAISGYVTEKARSEEMTAQDLLDQAEKKLFEVSKQGFAGEDFQRIGDILNERAPTVDHLIPGRIAPVEGLPSPFLSLDRLTTGFQKGDVILIAGRPSMGKTSLAMNIADYLAVDCGAPVAIFSLEQSKEELLKREICAQANVDSQRLRRALVGKAEVEQMRYAMARLKDAPLYIDDTGGATMNEIRAKSRILKARHGIQMVIIDYIQLIRSRTRAGNREQEVAQISQSLKALAKELDIPLLVLCQLSRAVENRDDKRPRLADLRESGALEQDCDVCLFVYRPEKYDDEDEGLRGYAEIIVGKQRNGPVGMVPLCFRQEYTRFDDLALAPRVPQQERML